MAPWLAEPADLDEARGFKKSKKAQDKITPQMQGRFCERLRTVQPYRDLEQQIHKNCHGKGGVRRSVEMYSKVLKKGKRKANTELEESAVLLGRSACRRHAKCLLGRPDTWPKADPGFPEIAFIGRSNVGKSSLLNKITQFGTVAAVSPMPGRTKHVSWYRNRKVRLDMLDMPGYGHADRAKVFGPEALSFVKERTTLRALYVLIDARHGFKRTDYEWLQELGSAGPMKQVVLTKCDLLDPKRLLKIASLVRSDLEGIKRVEHKLMLCSSVTQAGIYELRLDICRRCELAKAKHDRDDPLGIESRPVPSSPQRLGILSEPRAMPRGRDDPRDEEEDPFGDDD